MLSLHELQTDFEQSVAGVVPDRLLQLIAGRGSDPAALLAIYRNNVVTRLTNTLSEAFPVVCKLVDRGFFEYAADAFLRQHLPASGCLSEYGGDFPLFLSRFAPAGGIEYLADVARLEWAIHEIRHAPAPAVIALMALAAMPGDPSLIRLQVCPAVRYVASSYPVDQVWIVHQGDKPWDGLQIQDYEVCLQVDGRNGLRIDGLSASTWEFRAALAANEVLGTAIAAALARSPDFDPPSALAALFSEQLIVGLN